MITMSMTRMVVPFIGAAAICGAAFVVIQHVRQEPPVENRSAATAGAVTPPAVAARDPGPASQTALAFGQARAMADALAGPPLPAENADGTPSFDVARIEPNGEAVIAGRAAPGVTVDLLRNGEPFDRAVADQLGQFVMVPPRLSPGTYDLTLRATRPDGTSLSSKQSVAVTLESAPNEKPVVALMTPEKPVVVLSGPAEPKPAAGTVVVDSVDAEPGGKLHVSGRARAAATLRLYLNDSFVTSVTAGADGAFAVTINQGVVSGSYRIRLDEVDSASGTVRARAEVPFNTSDVLVTASLPSPAASRRDASSQPQLAAAEGIIVPDGGSPSAVVVPKISTTTVTRGDNLWRISRLAYGGGMRYATIYKANKEQIRNPNLIYPGQIFVLPTQ